MSRLALLLSLMASPAWAHAVLVDSTPAPNGRVKAGTLAITLRYNSRIDPARSRLTLSGTGAARRLAVHGGASPDLLQAEAPVEPGAYTLRWQVLARDGHITRGSVPFSVEGR